jgi:nucleoside-diphosphate-sugar epimerase
MVVVAVAGGLGDLGRLIAEALIETGKHEVYVMSRKVRKYSGTRFNLLTRPIRPGQRVPFEPHLELASNTLLSSVPTTRRMSR